MGGCIHVIHRTETGPERTECDLWCCSYYIHTVYIYYTSTCIINIINVLNFIYSRLFQWSRVVFKKLLVVFSSLFFYYPVRFE